MEIILTKDVKEFGRRGEVKTVKPGYFRNFLSPNGLAFTVTPKRLVWAQGLQEKMVKEKEEIAKQAEGIKTQLEEMTLELKAKTTDKDTLYGSIGEKEIIAALEDQAKIKLTKKQIKMDEHIKKVGKTVVKIELAEGVVCNLNVEVSANE